MGKRCVVDSGAADKSPVQTQYQSDPRQQQLDVEPWMDYTRYKNIWNELQWLTPCHISSYQPIKRKELRFTYLQLRICIVLVDKNKPAVILLPQLSRK